MKPFLVLLAIALGGVTASSEGAPSPPESLRAEPLANPLGLDLNEYAFAWKAEEQAGYRILVASDRERLRAGGADLWDSGRRPGEQQESVRYLGSAIDPGGTVWWKVRVWDAAGEPSEWSAPAEIGVPKREASAERLPRPTGWQGGELRFVDGRLGQALQLSAEGPAVWAEDYAELRPATATTIMAWIRTEELGDSWQCIFRKEDGNDRRLLAIGKEGPFWGLWCGFGIAGEYVEFGAPYDRAKLADGKWHHVAVTFDGSDLRLFVDGQQIGERRAVGPLGKGGSARAYLGSHGGAAERFQGALDDVRVFAEALDPRTIRAVATAPNDVTLPPPVAHWTFDETIDNEATYQRDLIRNRIVLLGGTLISRMDQHGFFEASVTVRWPHHDITFRNLGWPADDVFGTARSEFGSAHNTRSWQPPAGEQGFGFEKLLSQLDEAQASTIMVGYGAEAAFADTAEKMQRFEAGYRALIDELEHQGARLVLLTPVAQARHGDILPDPEPRNARLARAARFIKALAKARGHRVVDLFERSQAVLNGEDYENGVHLNERGYQQLSEMLTQDFRLPDAGGGQREDVEETKRGERYDFTRDQLPRPWRLDAPLAEDTPGAGLWIDAEKARFSEVDGVPVQRTGPDFAQAERLREVIVEKNRFHRYKLNPINKAYIFLFRRHEMGHLAYEMEDFDELVNGREQVIAKLRVPLTRRYEVVRAEEWKPPRDYPDHEVPKDIPAPGVEREVAAFKVADGFQVNLFAKNPMLFNPINLNWDRHGRAWVATSSTYPHIKPGRIPNDRIVILTDSDHDGVADTHKIFAEGLTVPHSVMPVEGGAYVCSTTELLFLADRDGDDVADDRRVVFSGFGNADVHHMIHGLRWAPWGDLFFTQSIYINSFVETAHGPRRLNGSGIWRFRPERERLDVFARGMVNPWGFAFDRWGRGFGTDGAGGSGPHDVFPGSAFGTAVGAPRVLSGLIPGKPKNTAAEFMTGRHIPSHWQGSLLANDFRANRTVRYELEERGSGFTAREVETVLASSHRSFRPVDIKMGPDGAVYVVDWYNPIIDHGEVDFHHPLRDKSHGRIWRLTAKGRRLVDPPTIAEASVPELLDHLKAPEQYTRVQANRELVRRGIAAFRISDWVHALDSEAAEYDHHRLEALWLCHALNVPLPESLQDLHLSPDPRIRAAVMARADDSEAGLERLALGVQDEHPRVRLAAVGALRQLGTLEASDIALRALGFEVDENLDFALEMAVRDTREEWLPALTAGKKVFGGNPDRLSYALKKVNDPRAIDALLDVVKAGQLKSDDLANAVTTVTALGAEEQIGEMLAMAQGDADLLESIARGAQYSERIPPESERAARHLSARTESVRVAAAELIGRWKVSGVEEELGERARAARSARERLAMTTALARLEAREVLSELRGAGHSHALRAAAIAAQASLDPQEAAAPAARLLSALEEPGAARLVVEGFLARQDGPSRLAAALREVSLEKPVALEGVRTVAASGRAAPELTAALTKAGALEPVSQTLSSVERRSLLEEVSTQGSPQRGEQIFERTSLACATCHLVDRKGGKLGPDLSTVGSYMTPESILESLLNPSTDIKQGYETVVVTKKDETLVSGLLQRKTDTAVLVRGTDGKVVSIPNGEVSKIDTSPVSLMPPGLTSALRRDELVDLMSYLTSLGMGPSR